MHNTASFLRQGLYKLLLKPKNWTHGLFSTYRICWCWSFASALLCFSAEKSGILAKIGAKKTVFREPRGSGDSDKVLHDYSKTIRWMVTNHWLADTMERTGIGSVADIFYIELFLNLSAEISQKTNQKCMENLPIETCLHVNSVSDPKCYAGSYFFFCPGARID